jgi:hypothetical protein
MNKESKQKVLFLKEEYADGQGKYFYSDGASYEGEWENGKRHGKGILTLSDGRKLFGKWNLGGNNDTGIVITPDGVGVND